MRTFKNYIDAAKRRKLEETGEEGFSLIELIIVVVILGILVAIAIPLFGNIQAQAQTNAAEGGRRQWRHRRSRGIARRRPAGTAPSPPQRQYAASGRHRT